MDRWKVEPIFSYDPSGAWVRAEDVQVCQDQAKCSNALIAKAEEKILWLENELVSSRSSERISAAKLAQADMRIEILQKELEVRGDRGQCFDVALHVLHESGDSTKNLSEWLRDRLTQAKSAEARVKELERSLEEAINQRDLARSRHAYASAVITQVEQKNNREGDAKVTELAHRHGWIGGIPLLDWLDRKLGERNDYHIRLNKLRDVLGQEQ